MRFLLVFTLALTPIALLAEDQVMEPVAPPMQGENDVNTSSSGVAVNEGTLRNDFRIAQIKAEAGDPDAQLELAQLYIEGKGTEADQRKANYWLDKAARQGLREAQVMLADRYYDGTGTPRPYYAHALKWYIEAGEKGQPHAAAMAGKMFYKGIGTKRDYQEAFRWLYESAQRRDAESQHLVGVMYRFGHGMEKNYLNSYIWLHVAYESTKDPAEKENIRKQRDRVATLMPENELLGAKLLAPEYADMYAWKDH
ncbi:MAG: sel1 repeat family protein [Gammaproteobacteria bacterium]|nr:sel1 repeat family protein [Gammaproteobacteria bacterium]